jgi:acetyltransferase-like isoleucine patch superfamily enzyme
VFIWSGNHIGHHSRIEDNCFISSHCVISGNAVVGEGSFLGVNSTIRDGITIGKQCVIGAGTLVLENLPDFSVVRATASEISKVPSNRIKL